MKTRKEEQLVNSEKEHIFNNNLQNTEYIFWDCFGKEACLQEN